jgi:FAD synthetase
MSLEKLVSKYVSSAKQVLERIEVVGTPMTVDIPAVKRVVDYARDYLRDAEHYREKEKFEVSLTSVAYCEGLLDALRLLGAVKFEWPGPRNDAK